MHLIILHTHGINRASAGGTLQCMLSLNFKGRRKCGFSAAAVHNIQLKLNQHLNPVFLNDTGIWLPDSVSKRQGKSLSNKIRINLPEANHVIMNSIYRPIGGIVRVINKYRVFAVMNQVIFFCHHNALQYLTALERVSPEKQLEKYLKGKGFSPEAIQNTLENMKQWGYIDDAAYARAYIDYRLSCSKKSWRAIFYDLKAEGINEDTIEEVTGEYDADEYLRARDVAARVLNGKSDEASLRRLNGLLARNGFGWDVVNQVVSEASRGEEF